MATACQTASTTSCSAGLVIASLPPVTKASSMVGVTTFIKQSLCGGVKFGRRTGKRSIPGKGLCVGRIVDAAFNRHITGEEPYAPANVKHARLGHIVRALAARHITLVCAQKAVCRQDLGIRTSVDALGTRPDGALVVVELKTTSLDRATHERVYNTPCLNKRVMSNGIMNSEKMQHMLQAGFGVVACRRHTMINVMAVVVMSYRDSAVVHTVPESFCSSLLFNSKAAGALTGTRPQSANPRAPSKFDAWPMEDERVEAVLRGVGVTAVKVKGVSNVVVASRTDGADVLVAGCVRGRWSSVSRTKRNDLLRALLKTHTDVFGRRQSNTQTYVLAPHGSHWRLHKVAPPS